MRREGRLSDGDALRVGAKEAGTLFPDPAERVAQVLDDRRQQRLGGGGRQDSLRAPAGVDYVFPGGRVYFGDYTNQVPCRGFAPLFFA